MWSGQHTLITSASRTAIWNLWSNVDCWRDWDHTIEASTLHGAFQTGSTVSFKPTGAPLTNSIITACQPLDSFTNETKLPFAKVAFVHQMVDVPDGIKILHRVQITGPLGFLFSRLIGRQAVAQLPKVMAELVRIAEEEGSA